MNPRRKADARKQTKKFKRRATKKRRRPKRKRKRERERYSLRDPPALK